MTLILLCFADAKEKRKIKLFQITPPLAGTGDTSNTFGTIKRRLFTKNLVKHPQNMPKLYSYRVDSFEGKMVQ